MGAPTLEIARQVSAVGLYAAPSLSVLPSESTPPQTIISVPVQTALWPLRALGAPVALMAAQLCGENVSFLPSPSTDALSRPPNTIMALPVLTALWAKRGEGALTVVICVVEPLSGQE